ncbi:MAG: ureF, partial [Ilumatobacteraceae bacterium]|nr:ureF [Ilumatobacteraceae bacterium]
MNAALLLLADGRFPSGGHAHSGGAEPAVGVGDITDLATLGEFVDGRLQTSGLVDAAFAAAICARCASDGAVDWRDFELEYLARTGSPRLRTASRTLGRQLLRGGRRAFSSPRFDEAVEALGTSIPQPIVMGLVAAAAGCTPSEAALCELHHLVGSLTTAAVRLLGLDPFAIAATGARLAPELERLAEAA